MRVRVTEGSFSRSDVDRDLVSPGTEVMRVVDATVFWLLVIVAPWLTAYTLRRLAQQRRRLTGRPTMSLLQELRWLLVLLLPWGMFLAAGAYAIGRSCFEDDVYDAELAAGVTADAYCTAQLHQQFPGTFVAVSCAFVGAALVWTATVLVVRARERRHTPAAEGSRRPVGPPR